MFILKAFPFGVSDYVYNPKEARIRKAMRDATRERTIGASPMLPRPNARRPPPHPWMTSHEDQLMMVSVTMSAVKITLNSQCRRYNLSPGNY